MEDATVPGAVQSKAAGGLYTIRLEAVASDGKALPAASTISNERIQLSIQTGPAADPDMLGLYRIGSDGKPV